jgi:hypothetical protein
LDPVSLSAVCLERNQGLEVALEAARLVCHHKQGCRYVGLQTGLKNICAIMQACGILH